MYISCPVSSWWLGHFPSDSLAGGFLAGGSWSDHPYGSHSVEFNGILAVSPWKFSPGTQGYQIYRAQEQESQIPSSEILWTMVSGSTFVSSYFFPEPIYAVCGDAAPYNVHRFRVTITYWRGCPILTECHLQLEPRLHFQKAIPLLCQADSFWLMWYVIGLLNLMTMYPSLCFLCCEVVFVGYRSADQIVYPKIVVLAEACGQERQMGT